MASRSGASPTSSSSRRTSAPDKRRSPVESRASIAWARVSGSSDRRQRRMTPPASGAPSTTSAPSVWSSTRRSRRSRTSHRKPSVVRVVRAGGGLHSDQDGARSAEVRGPIEPFEGPVDDVLADVGPVPAQGHERGLLGAGRAVAEEVDDTCRRSLRSRQGARRGASDGCGLVIEGVDEVGLRLRGVREGRDCLDRGRPHSRRRVGQERADGVERCRAAQPSDGLETRHPRLVVWVGEQRRDDPFRARLRAARAEQAGDGGPHRGARVPGELGQEQDRRKGRIVGDRSERPDGGLANAVVRVEETRLGRGGGSRRPAEHAQCLERRHPHGRVRVVVDDRDERRPGPVDRGPAEQVRGHPADARLRGGERVDQGRDDGRVRGQCAQAQVRLRGPARRARHEACATGWRHSRAGSRPPRACRPGRSTLRARTPGRVPAGSRPRG